MEKKQIIGNIIKLKFSSVSKVRNNTSIIA